MATSFDDQAKDKNGQWQHLVQYCLDLYADIKDSKYRANVLAESKTSRSVYSQEEKATSEPWEGASNITMPLLTISVDNLEPRVVSSMVGEKPFIEFEMGGQAPDEQTQIVQDWYNNELEDVVGLGRRAGEITHDLLLDGTVFPICGYDLDEVTRRYFVFEGDEQDPEVAAMLQGQGAQPVNGMYVLPDGTPATIDRKEPVFEGGKLDIVPLNDVYIPDNADDWEKTPVLRRVNFTYAELMQKRDDAGFMNVDTWLAAEQGENELEDQSAQQEIDSVLQTAKKTIRCLECYVSYIYRDEEDEDEDVTDFTEERLVVLIALDKKVIIRILKLRDINFKNEHIIKRMRLFPEKGKSYGTSLYGKTKSIQNGASKTFNTAINIADVTMIPWFLYEARTGLRGKQKKLQPGMGIEVDNAQGLYFPKFNINPSQMIDFIYLWTSFWEKLVSIGDLQVGRVKETGSHTATETMAVIQEGNVKHNYQAETFRDEFICVLRTLYDLYYQSMPMDKTFLYNGENVPISRQDMRRPVKFRLTGSTELSNKLIKRKENEDFYTLTGQDPVFDPIQRGKDLVKSYGRTDVDKYINPQMNQIVQAIVNIPGAAELFQQAMEQAQQMAQEIEQGGKAAGAVAAQ